MTKTHTERRKEHGLLTMGEAAEQIDVPPATLQYHARLGYCVSPAITIDGIMRRYYTAKDVEALREYFAGRQKRVRNERHKKG